MNMRLMGIVALCILVLMGEIQAAFRFSTSLSTHEELYLHKRDVKAQQALSLLLGRSLDATQVPRIAACFSGGGYRSMIATSGWLVGLEQLGLLDAISYLSGISGSTWFIAPWISSGMNLHEIQAHIRNQVTYDIFHNIDYRKFIAYVVRRLKDTHSFSIIEGYGALLAQKLLSFSPNPHGTFLHEQAVRVDTGEIPYPLYMAGIDYETYQWLEFNPHEIMCDAMNASISTLALDCVFNNGFKKFCYAQSDLGYLMGIWGSAFNKFFQDFVEEYCAQHSLNPTTLIAKGILRCLRNVSCNPAEIYNFGFGHPEVINNFDRYLPIIDVGIYCNLGLYPLLKPCRKIDVLLVFDASKEIENGFELDQAIHNAQINGLKVPDVHCQGVQMRAISVFESHAPDVPTIIYIPLIKNAGYGDFDPVASIAQNGFCRTTNFCYSNEEFDLLAGLTEYSIKALKDDLREVIVRAASKKIGKS